MSDRVEAALEINNRSKWLAQAVAACPSDLKEWGQEHGIPSFAEVTWIAGYLAALAEADRAGWQPIETAPRDGTLVWVYVAEREELPAFQAPCAWHEDAGWCCDELRPVTHWVPIRSVWRLPPVPGDAA